MLIDLSTGIWNITAVIEFKGAKISIAVIGLGYVGLPLAVEFSKYDNVVGFDIGKARVKELNNGIDSTGEVSAQELKLAKRLTITADRHELNLCNVYIVTVPTPIDENRQPDLNPLLSACETLGGVLKKNDIVIFESTVYPGCTEEVCVPALERHSGLRFNVDFFCGYSPERINPGDKNHRLPNIKKVVSGSTTEVTTVINDLYLKVIKAGTHLASSIKVAEAAKVIENTQRDLNIALINELAIIFNLLDVDTEDVLEAASTKWNFIPFKPGLVGGHCIGVDPYYLTYKAQKVGYEPDVILAGRKVNDNMSCYVASQLVKAMTKNNVKINGAKVLILGLAFKENCPDIRNTKVVDLFKELADFGLDPEVFDPIVDPEEAYIEYNVQLLNEPKVDAYDAIIIAVAHDEFSQIGVGTIRSFGKENHILYDLKYVMSSADVDMRL